MKLIPNFSLLLRSYRERHGLTQQQVAARLQLSRNYISQIERGESVNLSFNVARRILNLEETHGQIQVTLTRRVMIDAMIAPEIVWLNSQGIETAGCCIGPPPTAMIIPSSAEKARELGYEPEYREGVGLFEITLKSEQRPYLRAGREPAAVHGVGIGKEHLAEKENKMSAKTELDLIANYIMASIPGEPSRSEGAGECAVRLLGEYRAALIEIMHELGVPGADYPVPVANAYEIARQALGEEQE